MLKTENEIGPGETRCDRTIQDNQSAFQQALYASFPIADHRSDI
jgi:hypothetical protein